MTGKLDNSYFQVPAGERVNDDAVVAYIGDMNEREDYEEGMVPHRIRRFAHFERTRVPLDWFRAEERDEMVSDSLVAAYAAEPACEAPPIVVDSVDRAIIDGFHRFQAAITRGDTDIEAFVGRAPRANWVPWQEPDEEPMPEATTPGRRGPSFG